MEPIPIKFASAGIAACVADVITFPFDIAKVKLQVQGEVKSVNMKPQAKYSGVFGTMRTIVLEEGLRGVYKGIFPALQRQVFFASIRIGLYDSVKGSINRAFINATCRRHDVNTMSVRIPAGVVTGSFATLFAQPTDVVKIRMQAQSGIKVKNSPQQFNGSFHAYRAIVQKETWRGLYKGCVPNMTRNAVVSTSELVSYDVIKEFLLGRNLMSDSLPCHFTAGCGAGFITTIIASPIDVVKTRFMNSSQGQYAGAIDCAKKLLKNEGAKGFYKGVVPSFLRISSWNIVMFVTYEQIKKNFMTKYKH